jgi:TetR/AcrR family transcriptional regulator of autoinduction and epiphytic fitness
MLHIDARVERSIRVIREAAISVLARSGWGGFTIEAVAAEAGVARTTVYRHWPDKLSLLVDALEHHSTQPPADETAPGRARVVALLRHLAEAMADPKRSPIVPALIDAAERDVTLRRLQRKFTERRRKALTAALADSGVEDPDLVAMALSGAVIYCRVMIGRPFDPARTEELVTSVIGASAGRR